MSEAALDERGPNVDYAARGMASEAMSCFRSHEKMDDLRFKSMDDKLNSIQKSIDDLRDGVRAGFKSYDSKFWSLAVTLITLLVSAVGVLIYHMIVKG